MKLLRTLAVVALVVGLAFSAAYGFGRMTGGAGSPAAATDTNLPVPAPTATPSPPPGQPRVERKTIEPGPVLEPGDHGRRVRALQARLFQVEWFPEVTTGHYDGATREAVSGFQGKRGFKTSGVVDRRTWRRLVRMTDEPTHDQMFNILHPGPAILARGDSGSEVRDLRARLVSIQWLFGDVSGEYDATTAEAVRGFQEKRGIPVTGEVDQRTLDRLHGMTSQPTYEAMHNIEPQPGALDPRCETGRALCIDKTSQTLRWVVDGEVVKTLDARFGSTISNTPTREGLFHVYWKDEDHVSHQFGSAMPYSMFFSGGQAVHYSSDFAARGYAGASHGCVNIRDHDGIAWLFGQVSVGDTVVVYWS